MSILTRPQSLIASTILTWVLIFCAVIVLSFALKSTAQLSRGSMFVFFFGGVVVLVFVRLNVGLFLDRAVEKGWIVDRHRVIVIGDLSEVLSSNAVNVLGRHGYKVMSVFLLRSDAAPSANSDARSVLARVEAFVRQELVDEIMLVFGSGQQADTQEISIGLRSLPIPVRLIADRHLNELLVRPSVEIGPIHAIEVQSAPLSRSQRIAKRTLDLVLSSVGLILLAPVFVLVAAAIKFDSRGPVFFRQSRAGFSSRTFKIWKFRTMHTQEDGEQVRQATRNDSRVTSVGAMLRRTSIDEIPQLLNVLSGEMSLVGPRPHALSHDTQYNQAIASYAMRHHMKPGITGWAQINGYRGETPYIELMRKRVEHDIWYIDNWSVWLDLKVIVLTAMRVWSSDDVY